MNLWAVVLAGGEGIRLRPPARQVLWADRPKQYEIGQTREQSPIEAGGTPIWHRRTTLLSDIGVFLGLDNVDEDGKMSGAAPTFTAAGATFDEL